MNKSEVYEEMGLPKLCEDVCHHHLSTPHVGFRMSSLSRMRKSDRESFVAAEKYYKKGIEEGSNESLFLLMLLYAAADEKHALIGIWKWVRRDKEYFMCFAAYYLSMICVMGSPLPKEVIRFLSPYYAEVKLRFVDTHKGDVAVSTDSIYDKAMVLRYLDIVFKTGRQVIAYPDYVCS